MRLICSTLITSLFLAACCSEHESAECGAALDTDALGFVVTTTTGDDASDADIYFCVETNDGQELCAELASSGDDFDERETEAYEAIIPVSAGNLAGFYIHNQGGATFDNALGLTDGNDWDLAGLKVQARLVDGRTVTLYDEPEICDAHLEGGEIYEPMACDY